MIEIISSGLLV